MKNDLTEIVFIIDASGSMHPLTQDTIGGFNSAIESHRKSGKNVLVTTVLFNDSSWIIHDRIPIEQVPVMTEKEYSVGGCTALIDAMGETVHRLALIHKYARNEDVPEKTLFIITTDGMENASTKYNADEVRRMVKHEEEKYGWEFIFLGANIDSVNVAARYGIREDRAVNYVNDSVGNQIKYETISEAMACCVARESLDTGRWRIGTDKDFKKRGK